MECKEFFKPIDKPYTKVGDIKKNPHYARLLLNAYGGMVSELTGILTYRYQHLIIESTHECIARALSKISIQEMHHLELLGDTIIALGGDPMYMNRMGQPWTSQYVNYSKGIRKMLIDDINTERMGIADYENLIKLIPEPLVQNLLKRIIEDEECHIEALTAMLGFVTFAPPYQEK